MQEPNPYKIPWSGRSVEYTSAEIDAVVNAMKTADPLTQGKYLKEFESKFSEYLGVKNSFAVSSATAALELAAILTRVGKGDEVIIPAHTFCATAIPFARTGAKVVWADIDRDTRIVTAKTLEKCITKNTKVIVVVHLYGLVANMPEIMALAQKYNILVVEDCAQAIGAEYQGKKAGAYGDFACFSFHCQKSINTLGEGGMLVVKSDEKAKLVAGLRHNGVKPYPAGRDRYWVPAMSNVDFDIEGFFPYNFCIGEVQCALGIEILKTIDAQNQKRKERAKKLIDALKEYPELSFQKAEDGQGKMHVYHLLSAQYDGKKFGKTRNDLIELLAVKYQIKTVVQYYPLYRYPLFQKTGFGTADCPNTDEFFDNMISFPFHIWMPDADFEYLIDSTKNSLEQIKDQILAKKNALPHLVVGIGGGSVMDIAKGVSIMLTNNSSSADYQGWDLPKNKAIFKMAVPTLSGTGSEATRTAVLTSLTKKQGINSDQSIFDAVVMDPELIKTVDLEQEFFTGMDCFIHCVESLRGTFINEFARSFAKTSKQDIEDFFLKEKNYGKLMMASYFGGSSIASSEVGVCNALSYGLSLVLGFRHGIANCIVFNQLDEFYDTDVVKMREMMKKNNIELPKNVTKGLTPEDMEKMVHMAFKMEKPLINALGSNWRNILTKEKVIELYKKM